MITRPMKGDEAELSKLKYPLLATPKLDGIRCLKQDGKALSASLKPIRNEHIATWIEDYCPDGFDGELIIEGKKCSDINSAVMRKDGTPDFRYYVFDYVTGDLARPYALRMKDLADYYNNCYGKGAWPAWVKLVTPVSIHNEAELVTFEEQCIELGYEGVMVRSPSGPYKCGRSHVRDGYLLKIKRFVDAEAVVEGFVEQMHNTNEQTTNELGRSTRSKHKAGLVPAGVLGALIVRDVTSGREFEIGTGFTAADRATIWKHQREYISKHLTYKYQPHGVKDKPRLPVFKFFRDPDDMS